MKVLSTAYHKGQNKYEATVQNGIVMLGNRPIVEPIDGDEDAQTLADRLNTRLNKKIICV